MVEEGFGEIDWVFGYLKVEWIGFVGGFRDVKREKVVKIEFIVCVNSTYVKLCFIKISSVFLFYRN